MNRDDFLHMLDVEADEQDRLDRAELYARHAPVSAAEPWSPDRTAMRSNRDQAAAPARSSSPRPNGMSAELTPLGSAGAPSRVCGFCGDHDPRWHGVDGGGWGERDGKPVCPDCAWMEPWNHEEAPALVEQPGA
jgi:hypothetical protein